MNQSGAQILLQSLEKKNRLLDLIIQQNSVQETILKQDDLDMDAFNEAIEQQGDYVEQLDLLEKIRISSRQKMIF